MQVNGIFLKYYFSEALLVKGLEAVLPVHHVPPEKTKLFKADLTSLVCVKQLWEEEWKQSWPVRNLLIIMSMVAILNSVLLPLTRAACSSFGVIVPDLLESTLQLEKVALYGLDS